MKKSFIFASLVAIVAIFAACDKGNTPAGDAPKARFTYDVDGLTVTFNNASKDAETYAWDFGDGSEISAEENPVHTYAAEGTYAVKLTAKNAAGENSITDNVVIEKPMFSIKIDGDFSDWDAAPAELLAVAEKDDMSYYEALYKIKFISDRNKVYFYIEFTAEEDEVYPVDMMINTGADEVGMSTWLWAESSVNILIEGTPYKEQAEDEEGNPLVDADGNPILTAGFADAGVYKFIGDTPDAWAWDALDITGALEASDVIDLGNGAKAFEGSIMRASLPGLTSFSVGVYTSDAAWSGETGALPQLTVGDEGNTNQPMLSVQLN